MQFKKRGVKGKANIRRRPATPPPTRDSDSDFSSSEDDAGHRVKRRKRNTGAVVASSSNRPPADRDISTTPFAADRSLSLAASNDATSQSRLYSEEQPTKPAAKRDGPSDGTYKGLANQTSFIQKNPDAPSRTVGPIKAPTNIRTVTFTDFAPDVCKDYKQTGFCGFGDNCKFLHSREAYQQGWELDKEWEKVTKGKKNMGGTVVASADRTKTDAAADDDEDDAALESIPFACIICKGPYRSPISTRCGHYFCEPCALTRYRKDPTCAACGAGTNGVFNSAKRLQKLLDRKRERAARRRAAAIEAGEEVSDEEAEEEDE